MTCFGEVIHNGRRWRAQIKPAREADGKKEHIKNPDSPETKSDSKAFGTQSPRPRLLLQDMVRLAPAWIIEAHLVDMYLFDGVDIENTLHVNKATLKRYGHWNVASFRVKMGSLECICSRGFEAEWRVDNKEVVFEEVSIRTGT
jgi:hypothetical protein